MLIFFDDIQVYTSSLQEHREHLKLVLKVLTENHLFAKRSKCKFRCLRVDYLGHVITENGILVDPKKIQAMKEWASSAECEGAQGVPRVDGLLP